MRRIYTLLISLLLCSYSSAQHYSIFPSSTAEATYFTNDNGYLRALQIDSIITTDSTKIYYPFKTARVDKYNYSSGSTIVYADTNAGSWTGKEITEHENGYTYIPTFYGDTVLIKNNAIIDEPWLFFKDTSAVQYIATVISVDTITINGTLDSAKTIRINSYTDGTINTSDSLNDTKIILTKNNGFSQAIDLYTFPYLVYSEYSGMKSVSDYISSRIFQNDEVITKREFIFKRSSYAIPKSTEIFDYQPGDYYSGIKEGPSMGEKKHYTDTIISRNETPTHIEYTLHSYNMRCYLVYVGGGIVFEYDTSYSSPTSTLDVEKDVSFYEPTLIPEKWGSDILIYYNENDTSFCKQSPKISFDSDNTIGDDGSYPFSHAAHFGGGAVYKYNVGRLYYHWYNVELYEILDNILSANVSGTNCDGNNVPVSASNLHLTQLHYFIYPNPAYSYITVSLPGSNNQPYQVNIYDINGKTILSRNCTAKDEMVSIKGLVPGMYIIAVSQGEKTGRQKLVILK